ncbi:hypothetical protein CDL15_Pgr015040 [Punica granatum]|uniref:Uncharacterized protein n=1 Tax=Punica granatum TaxID=22663 RepID=A0A218X178_PUNGR|nr:hypothetical protein CDL15_Pgr015040 [Punica granatum]
MLCLTFQETELAPTIEEYEALIQRLTPTHIIVEPNQYAMLLGRLFALHGICTKEAQAELHHG